MRGSGAKRLGERLRSSGAPSWSLDTRSARGTLLLRFTGPTLTQEVPALIDALTHHLPPSGAHIVFDIRNLEGHNSEVRAAFQRWLMDNRPRIATVTVVVNKAATIFKVATSVVKLATGLNIEVRDDLESDGSVRHLVG